MLARSKFIPVLISGLISGLIATSTATGPAMAQESRDGAATQSSNSGDAAAPNASVLLTRQSQRIEMLETDLRDMRGQMETDLRSLKMQITQLGNNASSGETATTAELRDLRDQVERLADAVSMASRRMERTLEITSDVEFRLLRMEKRMQTLMKLGGDDLASAAVQDDTIPAGETPEVSMQRDITTGEITWQMSAGKLNEQLEANNRQPQTTDLASIGALPASGDSAGGGTTAAGIVAGAPQTTIGNGGAALTQSPATPSSAPPSAPPSATAVVTPPKPEILPDTSPEEQYNFALQRAMQNDLETAEAAFAEFRQFNAGHPREADSLFWLGRIQFLRGQFEQAALTFSEFSRAYPEDARLNDTTIWVAESVSRFAPPDQACDIYRQLPSVVPEPSQRLTERLAALSEAANCGG
jgi:TolA-binding protein